MCRIKLKQFYEISADERIEPDGDACDQSSIALGYGLRDRRSIIRLATFQVNVSEHDKTQSYRAAMTGSKAREWKKAIAKEMRAHELNGTW